MPRKIQIVQIFCIDVDDVDTPEEAKEQIKAMVANGWINLDHPDSYTVTDHGEGSWRN